MFLELNIGTMFSGKTSYIIDKYKELNDLYNILIISHKIDNRFSNESYIHTHTNIKFPCIKQINLLEINKELINNNSIIIIEEAQFFNDLKQFIVSLLNQEKYIIVTGLVSDINQNTWNSIIDIFPYADKIDIKYGFCNKCVVPTKGKYHVLKDGILKENNNSCINIGSKDKYLLLCEKHFFQIKKKNN
jgi:thymidine kinase